METFNESRLSLRDIVSLRRSRSAIKQAASQDLVLGSQRKEKNNVASMNRITPAWLRLAACTVLLTR